MKKYYVYAGSFDAIPNETKYIHYESGKQRTLIFVSKKPSADEWKKLSEKDIERLSPFERQWYNKCRTEVNAEYIKSSGYQREMIKKYSKMLDKYAELLAEAQAEKDRTNVEQTC